MLELVKNLLEFIKVELNSKVVNHEDYEMVHRYIGDMVSLWKSNKEIGLFIITKGIKNTEILSKMIEMAKSFYYQLVEKDNLNSQFETEDKTYYEQYFKLMIFNTLPMISLSFLMDNLVTEFKLPEERLKVIFEKEFIEILHKNTH